MKSKEEIEQLAEQYWAKQPYNQDAYVVGYTQCQEDMADKWISVNDRLPNFHEYVLIYKNNNINLIGCYREVDDGIWDIYYSNGCDGEGENKVTHWMPLPNKPLKNKTNMENKKLLAYQGFLFSRYLLNKNDFILNERGNLVDINNIFTPDFNKWWEKYK